MVVINVSFDCMSVNNMSIFIMTNVSILHCITDGKILNMSCKSVIKQEAKEVNNLEAKEGFDICISLKWSKIAFKALSWPRHLLHIIYRMT